MKHLNLSLTCSRNNHDEFRIEIRDNDAIKPRFEIVLSPTQFAHLVSSVSVETKGTIYRPELFGRRRVCEDRVVHCPLPNLDREKLRQWLIENCQEDGWEMDSYLGSQHSVSYHLKGCILRYRVMRWEDN